MEIVLRLRANRIALAADIEKAFLMVSVMPRDRDVLRFFLGSEYSQWKPWYLCLQIQESSVWSSFKSISFKRDS